MSMLPPDPRYIFRSDMDCVHSILFQINSNIEHLYSGTTTGTVNVWDLKTNRELLRLSTGQDSCLNLQSTNDDGVLVQQKCGTIKHYRITDSQWILEKSFDTDFCHYCRFEPLSKNEILVPLKSSKVGILCTKTFTLKSELDPHSLSFSSKLGEAMVIKAVKNEHDMVLIGYEGGQLVLWDIRQKKVLSSLPIQTCPMALDFDVSRNVGVIGGPSEELQVFNLSDSCSLSDKSKLILKNPGTSVIKIRHDSKIISVGCWDSRVRIFSWKSLKPLAVLDQHRDTVHDIAYSSQAVKAYDNKFLMATASKDGRIALWDIYN